MKEKTKNVVIGVLVILLALAIILIAYLFTSRGNALREVTGKVIVADSEYVIIESGEEDYLISGIENVYEVGDEVSFTYKEKNLDRDKSPKTIEFEEERLLKRSTDVDAPTKDEVDDILSDEETSTSTPPSQNPVGDVVTSKNADEEVLEYIDGLEREFKASDIKESLKTGFITVVDFIFYDGTIKGHTFKDLSESAKLKVLSAAMYFDGKIDTYFPGYKSSISATTGKIYATVKTAIVETYLNVASSICQENAELCETAKDGFDEIKKNFGLTWSLIKDIAGDGVANLKNWYEIFSHKSD